MARHPFGNVPERSSSPGVGAAGLTAPTQSRPLAGQSLDYFGQVDDDENANDEPEDAHAHFRSSRAAPREVADDYDATARRFGDTGPHAYRATVLRDWVRNLDKAVTAVETAIDAMRGVDQALRVANERPNLRY